MSPSRGLLLFAPVVLAAAAGVVVRARSRQLRSLDLALAGVCVGHWLLVSATVGWWGGHAYGPRYMTDILPVLAFLSVPAVVAVATRPPTAASGRRAPRLRRLRPGAAALSVAVAWGVFVHAQGAYLRSSACWNSDPADVNVDFDRVWDWGDPQLVRGARALVDGSVRDAVLGDCAGGLGGTGTGTQTNGKP